MENSIITVFSNKRCYCNDAFQRLLICLSTEPVYQSIDIRSYYDNNNNIFIVQNRAYLNCCGVLTEILIIVMSSLNERKTTSAVNWSDVLKLINRPVCT